MLLAFIVILVGLAGYLFLEYKKLTRAISLSHTTPDQTGDYELGDKHKPKFNILLLGDSIAAGTGIEKFEQSLGGRLASKLTEKYYVHLSNRAELGSWVSDLALDKIQGDWDLVIIIAGSNDLIHRVSRQQFAKSLNRLLAEIRLSSDNIVLVGPGHVSAAHVLPLWMRFQLRKKQWQLAKIMQDSAASHKAAYVNPLEYPISQSYFSADGLHPNAMGHKIWFDIIWEKIGSKYS